jgi:hypothetical protein
MTMDLKLIYRGQYTIKSVYQQYSCLVNIDNNK